MDRQRWSRRAVAVALAVALGAGCETQSPAPSGRRPDDSAATRTGAATSTASGDTTAKGDTERDMGDETLETVEARFDIDRIPGGKMFQGSWLIFDDGRRLVLSYRPLEEYYAFVGRRVVARGRRYLPEGQAIAAKHFRLESMRLAEGEEPREDADRLPAPPTVRSRMAFEENPPGSWARVVGKLVALDGGDDPRTTGHLELEDATIEVRRVKRSKWAPLVGEQITVVSKLHSDFEPGLPPEEYLAGAMAVCEGDVARCGMEE